VKLTLLLCDAAQEVGGKLFILGGGWSVIGPEPSPMAIAVKMDVPWQLAGRDHGFGLTLRDEDGNIVVIGADEDSPGFPVVVQGTFSVARPQGVPPGSDIDCALAITFAPMPLKPGARYTWHASVDGDEPEEWSRTFTVRPLGGEGSPTIAADDGPTTG
jgi:hypothetical protein